MLTFKNVKQTRNSKITTVLVAILLVSNLLVLAPVNEAVAATNLIVNGSFEDNIEDDWSTWQDASSARSVELFRSYESAFGFGSYSAGIETSGAPEERWFAGLSAERSMNVEAGSEYYLIFYAKSTQAANISVYLNNAQSYEAVTEIVEKGISTNWEKHIVILNPNFTGSVILTVLFGDAPAGNIINLDGMQMIKGDFVISTNEVKGNIGSTNKRISISNIHSFTEGEIEVELPYFDNLTGQATTKIYNPYNITSNSIYITMPEQTFSGIGNVYLDGNILGQFNYNVTPTISDIYPVQVRADEDLVVVGKGFNPNSGHTFLVLRVINEDGRSYEEWVEPFDMDSGLTQITASMPVGVVSGNLYVYTSTLNKDGEEVTSKSNSINYKVKPIIESAQWSQRGYDQVGDKLLISGKGISNAPSVYFYDHEGNRIDTKRATLVEIGTSELIEVQSTDRANQYSFTVVSGGIESDPESAISQTAKPKITALSTKYSRTIISSSERIYAGKPGDTLTIRGNGFASMGSTVTVNFQGLSGKVSVQAAEEDINSNGTQLTVTIPNSAHTGYINIETNGQTSNNMPFEVIPTIVSISPTEITPGEYLYLTASGVGLDINQTKVYIKLSSNEETVLVPDHVESAGIYTTIRVRLPRAISSDSSAISLQYGKWRDTGEYEITANPHIDSASINMDNKVLTIKGYGFSMNSRENVLTYMYSDEDKTVISPKVNILGVYPTEEGQELRIQILDDYHYGYVTVAVEGQVSNEANFGPVSIRKIARRVEFVESSGQVMGVLYISGYNFGSGGGVMVGDQWADVHYRSRFFIIAVVDEQNVNVNPVIVARE